MNLSGSGLQYILLIIPALFASVVMLQGISKIVNHDPRGKMILIFGIIFLGLVIGGYIFIVET